MPTVIHHSEDIFFQPYRSEHLRLSKRIAMAPMTRNKAIDNIPTNEMADYYARRGDTGLIITEAVMSGIDSTGYLNVPGIQTDLQIEAWRKVSESVHQRGAVIFMQIYHAGMMSHKNLCHGKIPIAPSPLKPQREFIPGMTLKYELAREINRTDMLEVIEEFASSASNAIKAGFDGVELHAANGYLLDAFLHYYSNLRSDDYGGNPENMCRFVLEVLDAVIDRIGRSRVSIRLSPVPLPGMKNLEEDLRDQQVFIYLLKEIADRNIAYVHVSSDDDVKECGSLNMPVSTFVRQNYSGTLIGCGGYTLEAGRKALEEKKFDILALGKLLLANPDFMKHLQENPLNPFLRPFEPSMLKTLF
jgi:N-ethylmaleimide reductase